MDRRSSEELVRWCQRTLPDDLRGFEELVARYKQRIFATAYRIMGNQQDAEDQTQEVLLKVYRSIRSLDEPATFNSWLLRITVNTCFDALNQQRRRPQVTPFEPPSGDGDEEPRYADTSQPTPEEAALRREVWRCISTTLAGLDPTMRTALVLRDVDEYSYQEIADALTVGLSAAKMRIHRARLAFQKLLTTVCPDLAHSKSTG